MKQVPQVPALVVAVVSFSLIAWSAAWGVGAEVGRLEGTVTEKETGAPIPGATVTLTGSALIGPPRHASTDENGHYELPTVTNYITTDNDNFGNASSRTAPRRVQLGIQYKY